MIVLEQAAEAQERRRKEQRPKKLGMVNLTLVSFAVTRRAYERITQRFAKEYEAATGQPIRFRLSFGGSGTQVGRLKRSPFLEDTSWPATCMLCRTHVCTHVQLNPRTCAEGSGKPMKNGHSMLRCGCARQAFRKEPKKASHVGGLCCSLPQK